VSFGLAMGVQASAHDAIIQPARRFIEIMSPDCMTSIAEATWSQSDRICNE
jgi:hypothetical protein